MLPDVLDGSHLNTQRSIHALRSFALALLFAFNTLQFTSVKQACRYCVVFLQYRAIILRSARLLRIEYNASRASPQSPQNKRLMPHNPHTIFLQLLQQIRL